MEVRMEEHRLVPPYVFAFDPAPDDATAPLVEHLHGHGYQTEMRHLADVTVLVVGAAKVNVWGYGRYWRWCTGMANGELVYDRAPTSNPGAAARLIAAHLASRPVPLQRWFTCTQ